jgi:hypothetical protein
MEVFRFNILPMEEVERQEAFKEAINNCPICCASMKFAYHNDYLTNSIKEEAVCEKCALKIREEAHQVQ